MTKWTTVRKLHDMKNYMSFTVDKSLWDFTSDICMKFYLLSGVHGILLSVSSWNFHLVGGEVVYNSFRGPSKMFIILTIAVSCGYDT